MLAAIIALPYMAVFGLHVPDEMLDIIPDEWIPPALQATAQAPIAGPLEPELQYRAESPGDPRPLTPPNQVFPSALSGSPAPPPLNRVGFDDVLPEQSSQVARPRTDRLPSGDVETRLRELGAVDLNLEPWGGEFYRFEGRFAIDGQAALSRYFSAIEANPDAARRQVLAQVEAWRARR